LHLAHVLEAGIVMAVEHPRLERVEDEQQQPAEIVMAPRERRIGIETFEAFRIDAAADPHYAFGV
jgi:hypothetical protein